MNVTAVIVAKTPSTRLPNKNNLPFGDSTLLGHKISQLLECDNINEIVVGSNCDDILNFSKRFNITTVKRPDWSCDETKCSANDMIKNIISLISPTDVVLWSHCTNPNLQSKTYDTAINMFLNLDAKYDSLISVNKLQEHLWHKNKPINYNPWDNNHVLAKDLPIFWSQNGGIFIQSFVNIKNNNYFFGRSPFLFETPILESGDINTETDYFICNKIHERHFT